MACGNNHVSRAHLAQVPAPASDPQVAAAAALRRAEQLADQAIARQEAARKVQQRLDEFKAGFDQAAAPPGTTLHPQSPGEPYPAYSEYSTRDDKMSVYVAADGKPVQGNAYPHVHYIDKPGERVAVVSWAHGRGNHSQDFPIDLDATPAEIDSAVQAVIDVMNAGRPSGAR